MGRTAYILKKTTGPRAPLLWRLNRSKLLCAHLWQKRPCHEMVRAQACIKKRNLDRSSLCKQPVYTAGLRLLETEVWTHGWSLKAGSARSRPKCERATSPSMPVARSRPALLAAPHTFFRDIEGPESRATSGLQRLRTRLAPSAQPWAVLGDPSGRR